MLLPGERTMTPAQVGLRVMVRRDAQRRGRRYVMVGAEQMAPGPSLLPWYGWVMIGVGVAGLGYLAVRKLARDGLPASQTRTVEIVHADRPVLAAWGAAPTPASSAATPQGLPPIPAGWGIEVVPPAPASPPRRVARVVQAPEDLSALDYDEPAPYLLGGGTR